MALHLQKYTYTSGGIIDLDRALEQYKKDHSDLPPGEIVVAACRVTLGAMGIPPLADGGPADLGAGRVIVQVDDEIPEKEYWLGFVEAGKPPKITHLPE